MYSVGPTIKRPISTTKASNMLILLNVLIPLSIPDHADQVNNMVVMTIKITCIVKLLGTLNKKCKPSFICNAPKPNVAATPVTVAMTANTSMAPPKGPRIAFSPNKGVNVALTKPGYPL
ncbi:Uncharacterised protein [Staphylococcus aureus]|nr:Uncharacterised protein [Staphylococcus aureus]CPM96194.1 Uncharacterised protein [Staphylococcus aureus]